ncbi:unnamed protein product [Caretta caretta]
MNGTTWLGTSCVYAFYQPSSRQSGEVCRCWNLGHEGFKLYSWQIFAELDDFAAVKLQEEIQLPGRRRRRMPRLPAASEAPRR